MPLRKALLVTIAVVFGFSVSVGPARAASSQPHPACPSDTILVKGGASTKHKTRAGESTLSETGHSPEAKETSGSSSRLAAEPDESRSLENHP